MVIVKNYNLSYDENFYDNLINMLFGTPEADLLIRARKKTNKYVVSAVIAEAFKAYIENPERQININYITAYINNGLFKDLGIEEGEE